MFTINEPIVTLTNGQNNQPASVLDFALPLAISRWAS